jgi:hypothetical protein
LVQAADVGARYADFVQWREPVAGLSFAALASLASQVTWGLPAWPRRALSSTAVAHAFELAAPRDNPLPVDMAATLRVTRAGTFHGILGSFRAQLAPGVRLAAGPGTHWRPIYFPTDAPARLRPGDRISLELRAERDLQYTWSFHLTRGATTLTTSRHSTLLAHPQALAKL